MRDSKKYSIEADFFVDINNIINEIRKSLIEDIIIISELPSLFIEESDGIKRIEIQDPSYIRW